MGSKIVAVGLTYKLVLVGLDSLKSRLHPPPNLLELDADSVENDLKLEFHPDHQNYFNLACFLS